MIVSIGSGMSGNMKQFVFFSTYMVRWNTWMEIIERRLLINKYIKIGHTFFFFFTNLTMDHIYTLKIFTE